MNQLKNLKETLTFSACVATYALPVFAGVPCSLLLSLSEDYYAKNNDMSGIVCCMCTLCFFTCLEVVWRSKKTIPCKTSQRQPKTNVAG